MSTRYCDMPGCESEAMETVPVSENEAGDSQRNLCHPCDEAYTIGLQHADFERVRPLRAILAEFINDVESVGTKETMDDWPDLYETYLAAMKLLHDGKLRHRWVEHPTSKATHCLKLCTGCGKTVEFAAVETR